MPIVSHVYGIKGVALVDLVEGGLEDKESKTLYISYIFLVNSDSSF